MPVDKSNAQISGILHGGVSVLLTETVASFPAAMGIDLEHQIVVGLEINANHLRPVPPDSTAEVTSIHRGKTAVVAGVLI